MRNWSPVDQVRRACDTPIEVPEQVLRALSQVDGAYAQVRAAEGELIRTARRLGVTWREIAVALSLGSPQAAAQRAGRIGAGHALGTPRAEQVDRSVVTASTVPL